MAASVQFLAIMLYCIDVPSENTEELLHDFVVDNIKHYDQSYTL